MCLNKQRGDAPFIYVQYLVKLVKMSINTQAAIFISLALSYQLSKLLVHTGEAGT